MGWSQQNANEFPDVSTTRTIQPGDINMTHLALNILMAIGTNPCSSEMFYMLYNGISFETELHGRTQRAGDQTQ